MLCTQKSIYQHRQPVPKGYSLLVNSESFAGWRANCLGTRNWRCQLTRSACAGVGACGYRDCKAGRKLSRNQKRAVRGWSARVRGGASIPSGARLRPPPASTVIVPGRRVGVCGNAALSRWEEITASCPWPERCWEAALRACALLGLCLRGDPDWCGWVPGLGGGWAQGDSRAEAKLTPTLGCNGEQGLFSLEIRIWRNRKGT